MIKGVLETIKNEVTQQKWGFIEILLGTLALSMLGNMSAGNHKIPGQGVIRARKGVAWDGEETIRAGQDF